MKTYKQLITELEKFENQTDPACIMTFTDPDYPDESANYVDCSGVYNVYRNSDGINIVCSDNGTLTWEDVRIKLHQCCANNLNAIAKIIIGYGSSPNAAYLIDFNDEPVGSSRVIDCTVLPKDTIWNIRLETL
jgi:hypothetical protein